ncbi:MAG: cation:proton antiporter [Myxococcota bacterium]
MRPHRQPLRLSAPLVFGALLLPGIAHAAGGAHGPTPRVWMAIAAILLFAKLGGELAVRLRQPPVLGELLAGIVLGNLHLLGFEPFHGVADIDAVAFLAELGVVLLLFQVGLESTLAEMRKVAPQSGLVAVLGVVAPMALGYSASYLLMPDALGSLHLFVAATLAATSVGITARVLKDLGAMGRPETRVILGAAVIDDVLGLMVLAVVSAIAQQGEFPGATEFARIVGLAVAFLGGALLVGAYLMPGVFRGASRLRTPGVLGAISIGLALLMSGLASAAGLAAIVGAFAAGLVLDDVHVKPFGRGSVHDLSELIEPIVAVLAPIFFVRTGMVVDLAGADWHALALAGVLTVVAIAGKLVSGLGVRGGAVDRWTVGIGMVPRGEVGLIFADVGRRISTAGEPLIDAGTYMAVVLMVMVTTMITPPWLSRRIRTVAKARDEPSQGRDDAEADAAAGTGAREHG